MPELPEVETTLRGIQPHIEHLKIENVIVRHHQLRWPIPYNIIDKLKNHTVEKIERRAKYLLLKIGSGSLIIHLGMSGSLRILTKTSPARKHDHLDIQFSNQTILRFNDPRRFGTVLWTETNPNLHPLLKGLGPEPLTTKQLGKHLWQQAEKRKIPIKNFIMDNKIVVGVGNIYAAEALFLAKIHPKQPAHTLSLIQFRLLAKSIKLLLKKAIQRGGTTLRNFVNSDGKPGYFANHLNVYGRSGLPCFICNNSLKIIKIGQRSTVFCSRCQRMTK